MTTLSGVPVLPATESVKESNNEDVSTQQGDLLSGFPRRYATVEEVDEAICKNRSRVSQLF